MQCRRHGVSLTIEQYAQYKKRICFICDDAERRIQMELWPHAELTISNGPFRSSAPLPGRAPAHSWSRSGYLTLEPTWLLPIYITHLHHKQKSLSSPEVQHRLAYYEDVLAASGRLDGDPLDLIRAVAHAPQISRLQTREPIPLSCGWVSR